LALCLLRYLITQYSASEAVLGWKMTLEKKSPGFDEYLAGGFLANAPILFFTYAVKALLPEGVPSLELEVASVLAVAIGGVIAGYLVVRRGDRNRIRTGLKTGLSAFLVNFTFSSILFEGTTILYGLWILSIFCFSSVAGASLRRISTRSRALKAGTEDAGSCS